MATYENEISVKNNIVVSDEDSVAIVHPETTTAPETEPKKKVVMVGSLPEGAYLKWAPIPFESFGRTTRITNDELSSKIHKAFGQNFHELVGANVGCVNGNFTLELFFEQNTTDCPKDKIRNLVNLTAPDGVTGLFAKNQIVQNRANNKNFTLNDETKMLLSKFMYGGKEKNSYKNTKRWAQCIRQFPLPVNAYGDPFYRNGDRILVCVIGLDLRRVLQELYGTDMVVSTSTTSGYSHNNTTAMAYYEPRFIKMNTNGTFIMNIEQFDKGAVEKYVARENPQLIYNTGVMYW